MATASTARADDRERPVLRLLGAQAAADLAGQVVTGRELGRRREERHTTAFPTGLAALDGLLAAGGEAAGLPRGCLVELVGRASSGRLAATLSTLAAATAAGEAAAFVDLGDHLDPEGLAAAGADPDRLLWVRPRDLGEALAAAESILAGGLPLVVVDLGLPPVPGGRGAEASWLRLARAAQAHGAALLVSTPYRVSGTAAHAVVGAETRRGLYAEVGLPLLQGLALRFTLEKLRGHRPGATAATELLHPQTHAEELVPSNPSTSASVVHPFPSPARGRTAKSEKARAGSRPQPPPRPLATDGDSITNPPPPRPLVIEIPSLHAP